MNNPGANEGAVKPKIELGRRITQPERTGRGPVASRAAVKEEMGRGSIRSVKHLGQRSDQTAFAAERSISGKPVSDYEKKLLFDENPKSVLTYRAAKMSDDDIYEILKNQ